MQFWLFQPFLGQFQHVGYQKAWVQHIGYQKACTQGEKLNGNTFTHSHTPLHTLSCNLHATEILSTVLHCMGRPTPPASARFHLSTEIIGWPINSSSSSLYYYKMITSGRILEFKVSKRPSGSVLSDSTT